MAILFSHARDGVMRTVRTLPLPLGEGRGEGESRKRIHPHPALSQWERVWIAPLRYLAFVLLSLACLAGCGLQNKGMSNALKAVDSGERLVELLRSVKDAESGRAAADDVDKAFQAMVDAQKDLIAYEKEHGETRGRLKDIEKLKQDLASLSLNLEQEGDRLSTIPGLPAEFWEPMRRHAYEIVELTVQYMIDQGQMPDPALGQKLLAVAAVYREVPTKDIVEAEFQSIGPQEMATAEELLKKRLPTTTRIHAIDAGDGAPVFVIAPISIDEIVKAADFATVVTRNDASGEIAFRWGGSGIAGSDGTAAAIGDDLREDFEKALAEAESESQPEAAASQVLLEPPVEFDASHREAVERHGPGGVLRYELVNYQEVADAGLAEQVYEVMKALAQEPQDFRSIYQFGWVGPVENYPAICDYIATFAEIVDRDNAQQTLKLKVDATKLPPPDDEELLKVVGRWLPDASDKDYHKHLSQLMWNAEKLKVNGAAVDALLSLSDISQMDKEVRKQVARNFRAIAMEDSIADGRAVDGLVLYGGKFSVPVLVELLDRPGGRIDREITAALAKLKDPRGAIALAERLANDGDREAALEALREMGPVAEDPLMKAASSDDTRVVRQVIAVLSEMGTRKSYPTLRRLMRQKDEEISNAAKNALATIVYREKAKKGE
jgi:hypothetical protein